MIPTLVLSVASLAAEVGFVCAPDEGGGIVGLPPLSIDCAVEPPAEGTWEQVSWTFGEGSLRVGDQVSFVYDEVGQYTVSVRLDGWRGPDGAEDPAPSHQEYGYVTVCGRPVVRFTTANKGGLDYELVNKTVVAVDCIDHLSWEIFEGERAQGEPRFVFDTWSPRLVLPSEGFWTVKLTVGGLAGTTSAELTFDAKDQLTEDLTEGPYAHPCSIPGRGPSGSWAALAALAVLRRRRALA